MEAVVAMEYFIVLILAVDINVREDGRVRFWLRVKVCLAQFEGGAFFFEGKGQPFIAVASLPGDFGHPSAPFPLPLPSHASPPISFGPSPRIIEGNWSL